MLGVAIRTARRIGIHNEATLGKRGPFDAEMSRRLWWALVLFDDRISQIAGSNSSALDPTWDCKTPLNINDSALWPQMKEPPVARKAKGENTEAIFVAVRSELGDFLRHSPLHLDFTRPILKPLARTDQGSLSALESLVEEQYLNFCDMENPVHAMTACTARAQLAKSLLLESQSKHISHETYTGSERDTETSYAIRVLEQDTIIMASPLTKGFVWLNHAYFPFPAYMQITQDLRKRPRQKQAAQAWKAMNRNFEAWASQFRSNGPFFRIFSRLVLEAWEARKAANSNRSTEVPGIVQAVQRIQQAGADSQQPEDNAKQHRQSTELGGAGAVPLQQSQELLAMGYPMEFQNEYMMMQSQAYSEPFEQNLYMDWAALGGWPGWSGG